MSNDISHDNVSSVSRFNAFYRSLDYLRAANRGISTTRDRSMSRSSRSLEFIETLTFRVFTMCFCFFFLAISFSASSILVKRQQSFFYFSLSYISFVPRRDSLRTTIISNNPQRIMSGFAEFDGALDSRGSCTIRSRNTAETHKYKTDYSKDFIYNKISDKIL